MAVALLPRPIQHLGGRADEGQAGPLARPRQTGVLREEPVAGVHRVGATFAGDVDDSVDVEVARTGCPGSPIW